MKPRVVISAAAPEPSRRLPLVVVGVALGAGLLAFVVGMQVGQKREEQVAQARPAQEAPLDRLDRQARRLRTLRQRQELSFHDTLAGPVQRVKVARPARTAKVRAQEAEATEPEVSKAEVAHPESTESEIAHADQEASAEREDSADDDTADDDTVEHYALQVGAFPEKGAAQGLAQRLKSKGYATHIASASVDGKGVWYRVRVGRYGDRGQAETARSSLSAQEGLFALVVPEG